MAKHHPTHCRLMYLNEIYIDSGHGLIVVIEYQKLISTLNHAKAKMFLLLVNFSASEILE